MQREGIVIGMSHDRGYTFDGTKLRQVRLGLRWTQKQLADALGLHVVSIQMLERGRRGPSLRVIAHMEEVLGLTAEELGVIWTRPRDDSGHTDP